MLKKPAKILLAILLTTGISTLLSGCLVKKKDPASVTTFISTTNILRPYQAGDIINYHVQVSNPDGSQQSGTLQIKWEDTNQIKDPFSPTTYQVLKETTTLTIFDGDMNENTDELVRYVEQDNTPGSLTEGSMYLRAFDTSTFNEFNWLSPTVPPTSTLQKYEIFRSPLTEAGQIDLGNFYVAGDCTGTSCETRFAFTQSRTFEVTDSNKTVDITGTGIFENAYRVMYRGTINREANSSLFDILDVCGTAGNITSHETEFFVVAEIGVVKITNTCIDQASPSVIYTATLDSTSFEY